MKYSKRLRLAPAVALLATVGCNEDELKNNPPVDQTVEAKLAEVLPTTIMPLIGFMKTVSGRLTVYPTPGATGLDCPDITGWCTSGGAECHLDNVDGIDRIFSFYQCVVAGADQPLTLTANLSASPSIGGPGTLGELTITNLVLNGSPAISGRGRTQTQTCEYVADVQVSGMLLQAVVFACEADTYPTGGDLFFLYSQYQISIVFNGTSTPSAYAYRTSTGETLAVCTTDLEALTASCVPFP